MVGGHDCDGCLLDWKLPGYICARGTGVVDPVGLLMCILVEAEEECRFLGAETCGGSDIIASRNCQEIKGWNIFLMYYIILYHNVLYCIILAFL